MARWQPPARAVGLCSPAEEIHTAEVMGVKLCKLHASPCARPPVHVCLRQLGLCHAANSLAGTPVTYGKWPMAAAGPKAV